jgi:phenylpyruvate tautomerase PptA (4-oxalocrotonate tautomerase family)
MPLIRVEIREGWSHPEKVRLLDAIHAAAVEVLKIPDEDRTQILTEHAAEAFEFPPGKGDHIPRRGLGGWVPDLVRSPTRSTRTGPRSPPRPGLERAQLLHHLEQHHPGGADGTARALVAGLTQGAVGGRLRTPGGRAGAGVAAVGSLVTYRPGCWQSPDHVIRRGEPL